MLSAVAMDNAVNLQGRARNGPASKVPFFEWWAAKAWHVGPSSASWLHVKRKGVCRGSYCKGQWLLDRVSS
jgi:hypothetical protein